MKKLSLTCVSTLALSISVFASAIKPLMAQPVLRNEHDHSILALLPLSSPRICNIMCYVHIEFVLPIWVSISTIFSMLLGSIRGEVILFSTARHTPSDVWMPMAVDPNCKVAQSKTNQRRHSWEKLKKTQYLGNKMYNISYYKYYTSYYWIYWKYLL